MDDQIARRAMPGNFLDDLDDVRKRLEKLERSHISPAAADGRYCRLLRAAKTWDPASLGSGAVASTTVTVTGAKLADPAYASLDGIGANDVLISAHVEDDDTVRVVIRNETGGTLDIASGTLRVMVMVW